MANVLPSKGEHPEGAAADYPTAVAFYFDVSITGSGSGVDASFQDVSGLSIEMETETYVEGGGNAFVYRLPKGVKYQNLVLSRGIASAASPLITWCREVLEGGLAKGISTRSLRVSLLAPMNSTRASGPKALHSWLFTDAYPVKWQADSFNSQKNDVAIEKIELAFSSFRRERR